MRSGDLLSYLSMNCLLNGVLSCSRCYFVRIQSISQKFNSCVTDRRTDGPTDGRTNIPSYRDASTHLKKKPPPFSKSKIPAIQFICINCLSLKILSVDCLIKVLGRLKRNDPFLSWPSLGQGRTSREAHQFWNRDLPSGRREV